MPIMPGKNAFSLSSIHVSTKRNCKFLVTDDKQTVKVSCFGLRHYRLPQCIWFAIFNERN